MRDGKRKVKTNPKMFWYIDPHRPSATTSSRPFLERRETSLSSTFFSKKRRRRNQTTTTSAGTEITIINSCYGETRLRNVPKVISAKGKQQDDKSWRGVRQQQRIFNNNIHWVAKKCYPATTYYIQQQRRLYIYIFIYLAKIRSSIYKENAFLVISFSSVRPTDDDDDEQNGDGVLKKK